ncbi:hypothetical protein BH10PLA2_BH10PLA2_12480 [soil metagenome]
MTQTLVREAKRLVNGITALFGLRITRIPKVSVTGSKKYFNTGEKSPLEENSRELYNSFYADHAVLNDYYDERRLGFYAAVSQFIKESGVIIADKDIVDVGCGSGHLLAELKKWSSPRSLSGCDFAEESLTFSRKHFSGCNFYTHDIYSLLPSRYDVVICTEVLEHLERPFVAVRNLVSATRLGGVVILTVPNGRLDHLNEHINFWSPESWKVFIERECPECASLCSTVQDSHYNIAIIRCPPLCEHSCAGASAL